MSQPTQRHTNRLLGYSDDARAIIEEEGIILVSYRPLQAVWQGR